MSYARARLLLGMAAVGSLVVVSVVGLIFELPTRLTPHVLTGVAASAMVFSAFFLCYAALMFPFDVFGGYWLPVREGRVTALLKPFLTRWVTATALQGVFFVSAASLILACGKSMGLPGAVAAVLGLSLLVTFLQQAIMLRPKRRSSACTGELCEHIHDRLKAWGMRLPPLVFVRHADVGFTGGVVGFPGLETIVMPARWSATLDVDELAAVVARRAIAIHDGSRTRGLLVALIWNLTGFCLATLLPGAGVSTAAQVLTTSLGFALWSFVGLLTLPTLSRAAAMVLDERTVDRGIPRRLLQNALTKLDRMQDDEPSRPVIVETLFHPVPSISRRVVSHPGKPAFLPAWNVARTTLPLSWSCLGLLARAVHCNVGRPELWLLLPVD